MIFLTLLFLQRRLIYLPTKIPAAVVVQVAREHGFLPWQNPRGEIIGWKILSEGAVRGSVLIVHGNAGCAVGRDYIAQPLYQAMEGRMSVFVLEYPGYGARGGRPSKASLLAAAEEAFQMLPSVGPKYLVSESIGAGVATELAQRHPEEVAGMALLVPYHNLATVAQRMFWFLPAYFLLLDRFDPETCLKNYRGPVLFAVAGKDEILGAATGIRLHEGYQGRKRLQVFEGAGHNEVSGQEPAWWRETIVFWRA
ncbi:MAG TPA: alpha/beta hydrolase [Verrucomicrobiae bacterium]|nr:alpha/beta hydrolase [Verrucomicrobiae bacterium]